MKIYHISKAGKVCEQPHGKKPSGKLDSQLFYGDDDCDRDVVKKNRNKRKKKSKKSSSCDCNIKPND